MPRPYKLALDEGRSPMARCQSRRSVRLPGYDYASAGAYFVTICTQQHSELFGQIVGESIVLSEIGRIADACWREIPSHFQQVNLDEYVIMPNHVHAVAWIVPTQQGDEHAGLISEATAGGFGIGRRAKGVSCPGRPSGRGRDGVRAGSLGAIIASYKSAVTRLTNRLRATPGGRVWQRSYWEHVVRSEEALAAIRQYIVDNP